MQGQDGSASRGKILIDNNSRPISDDELCRMAFGLSFEQLILAIRNNKGGKYDHLYSNEGKNEVTPLFNEIDIEGAPPL